MNKDKLLILWSSAIVLLLLGAQAYFIIKDYRSNKERLSEEVTVLLDQGIDNYFTAIAREDLKRRMLGYRTQSGGPETNEQKDIEWIADSIIALNKLNNGLHLPVERNIVNEGTASPQKYTGAIPAYDSGTTVTALSLDDDDAADNEPTYMVRTSYEPQKIDVQLLSQYINRELEKKNLEISYTLIHSYNHKKVHEIKKGNNRNDSSDLRVNSHSSYLKDKNRIRLTYGDDSLMLLKESIAGFVFSLLLITAVIIMLLHLLRLLNRQKEMMQRNADFVSNMSHELKTPITTSIAALDGYMELVEASEKNTAVRYISIARRHLDKLHRMTDRILDTVALEGNGTLLQKEQVNISGLLTDITERYNSVDSNRIIADIQQGIFLHADSLHLENAVTSVLENAFRYGGDRVEIAVFTKEGTITIMIRDNGKTPARKHHEKLFEKYYRITHNANQHDSKGYGIGLYYARQVALKHGGILYLDTDAPTTTFKFEFYDT